MSQRHKHRPPASRVEAPEGLTARRAHVEDLLARGKVRDAVDAAKQLHKEARSVETEALLVGAYAARIRALIATGMSREARELAALVVDRYPGTRERILPLVRESAARVEGDLGPLLALLGSADATTRREAEITLRRVIVDPRALADHPALPEDDPLRQAAAVVSELFTAVTSGPLPEGGLERLDVISRHSPLAPWKLLVRAVDAYYRRDDAAVLANLSAIPADAAPARLVPALGCLAGNGTDLARPSLAERVLLDKVSAGRARFRAGLVELVAALGAKDQRRAVSVLREVAEVVENAPRTFRATFAATVLTQWMRLDLDPRPFMAALRRGRSDVEMLRQLALACERAGAWPEALPAWDAYLAAAQHLDAFPRTGREPSRVLLRMAGLIPTDVEEVLDLVMAEDEAELESLIREGEIPEWFDRGRLLERARDAEPHPDVFRALVAHWAARDPRRAETEAQAWRAGHPGDLDPLLFLARAAERRGAYRKALDLLGRAEAIDRVHPEVRRSRFRILLSGVERDLRDGRVERAREDIARLAAEPEAAGRDRIGYVQTLRWAAARRAGDAASASAIERELDEHLANSVLVDLLLGSVAATIGFEAPSVPTRPETALTVPKLVAIEGLARAADLLLPLARPLGPPIDLLARIELNPRGAPAAHLHSLCTVGLRANRPSLAYAAAGAGLELESGLTHRFLLARGRALTEVPLGREHPRARRCLRAARTLAIRLRDQETLAEASGALRRLRFSLADMDDDEDSEERDVTAEEIRHVIELERGRPMMPRFEPEPLRHPRRRGRRGRHKTVPSGRDFLDFLGPSP